MPTIPLKNVSVRLTNGAGTRHKNSVSSLRVQLTEEESLLIFREDNETFVMLQRVDEPEITECLRSYIHVEQPVVQP
jgi:hypothetical protein